MYSRKLYKFNFFKIKYTTFSTVNLINRQGVESRNLNNAALNWQLAKVWVTPQNNVHHNTLASSGSSGSDESDVVSKCSPIDFERYLRKIGLVISREKNVYVQDGTFNSKNVRVISSNQTDAELGSSILGPKGDGSSPTAHILLIRDHSDIGKSRKFVFYDESRKILISNSSNTNLIKERLEKI